MLTLRKNSFACAAAAGLAASSAVRAQCPPGQPQNVSATQGVWCSSVELDWTDVSGANRYDIYRNTENNYAESGFAGFSLVSDFTDLTVAAGTRYYYWVVARRTLCLGNNSSAPSAVRQGWRGQDPVAPTDVAASDGAFCNAVRVTWDIPLSGLGGDTDSFTIYRNTVNVYLTSEAVGAVNGDVQHFFDTTAASGQTYYYWVRAENQCGTAASSSDWGEVTQTGSAPANNTCATAMLVTGGSYIGSTTCATSDGTATCGSTEQSPDVWYRYVAQASGTLTVQTCTSTGSYDTVLSVYTGCPGVIANQIACDDDSCNLQSRVQIPVVQGQDYVIRVAGYEGATGNFVLTVTPPGGTTCYANCDASTTSPVLNVADFTCFLQRFGAGNSYANCDQSTTQPVLNVADFTCFLQRFAAGCP